MSQDEISPVRPNFPFLRASGFKARQKIENLRYHIQTLERPDWLQNQNLFSLGIPESDQHLPMRGLLPNALYEVLPERPTDIGASTGFCTALLFALLTYRDGRVLWCLNDSNTDVGEIYPLGLAQHGFDPSCLLTVCTKRDIDTLWVIEETLRSNTFTAVLGEVQKVSMIASRRLQLAAEKNGVLTLLLRPPMKSPSPSAATLRWRIKATISQPKGFAADLDEPGDARWSVTLFRSRGGTSGNWLMEWSDETNNLTLAASVCN